MASSWPNLLLKCLTAIMCLHGVVTGVIMLAGHWHLNEHEDYSKIVRTWRRTLGNRMPVVPFVGFCKVFGLESLLWLIRTC